MAFDPLATTADLTNRDIEWTSPAEDTKVDTFLQSASDEIRSAAGVPISRETFTVELPGTCEQWLNLPAQPVVSVANITLDGDAITDHKLIGGHLWRLAGWQTKWWEPSNVSVDITGGLTEIPTDIVDLVCAMTGHALAEAEGGSYASRGDVVSERIDDYSVQFSGTATTKLAGPMELPEATRLRLRARFGGTAALVTSR